MKEAARQLYEYLISLDEFREVMDGRIFPLAAEGDTPYPFSIYSIFGQSQTKDADAFEYALSFYFEEHQYDECVDFVDAMKVRIEERYDIISYTAEVSPEDYSYIGTINFKT